jgi:hypothetical protein
VCGSFDPMAVSIGLGNDSVRREAFEPVQRAMVNSHGTREPFGNDSQAALKQFGRNLRLLGYGRRALRAFGTRHRLAT